MTRKMEDLLERLGVPFDADDYGAAGHEAPTQEMLDALRRLGYVE